MKMFNLDLLYIQFECLSAKEFVEHPVVADLISLFFVFISLMLYSLINNILDEYILNYRVRIMFSLFIWGFVMCIIVFLFFYILNRVFRIEYFIVFIDFRL